MVDSPSTASLTRLAGRNTKANWKASESVRMLHEIVKTFGTYAGTELPAPLVADSGPPPWLHEQRPRVAPRSPKRLGEAPGDWGPLSGQLRASQPARGEPPGDPVCRHPPSITPLCLAYAQTVLDRAGYLGGATIQRNVCRGAIPNWVALRATARREREASQGRPGSNRLTKDSRLGGKQSAPRCRCAAVVPLS